MKELKNLPEKHDAKTNPELIIERSEVSILELKPILSIENKVGFIFDGQKPVYKGE